MWHEGVAIVLLVFVLYVLYRNPWFKCRLMETCEDEGMGANSNVCPYLHPS
ncbi:MAG: hypothetical protein AB1589_43755 [Cyanobacteriota bacterium]